MTTTEIRPFQINISQADVDDLQARLAAARWPAELPGDGWDTGVPVSWLKEIADYWRDGYDWRAAEKRLNAIPQYLTEIDGQRIHFMHARSANPDAMPLILTHGWPGSIVEFLDLIGPLTETFHVVIPSLPGFGFSGPVAQAGWDPTRIAQAWAELMRRLGYQHYGAQGGDLGGAISPELGRIAPQNVIGVHTNGGPGPMPYLPLDTEELATLSDLERDRVKRIEAFMHEEFGYIAIQSTRPQTLAYGLTDSPVGQLAWVMDKFREWTHPRQTSPEHIIDRDTLLTNASIYWFTGTAGSAAYVGYAQASWGAPKTNSGVPTAALVFAHDVAIRRYAETENTITRWTDISHGGHFAALEEPAILLDDIKDFFSPLWAKRTRRQLA